MRDRLGDLLVDLLALPCVTGEEGPITDFVEQWAVRADLPVRRAGLSLVAGEITGARPLVLLVGHLDVVPPTDEDRVPRRDGDDIVGRGASDMKAGLAVAMDCTADPDLRGHYDVACVAYAGEEGPHEANELGPLLEAVPELCTAVLAIVLEPTDLEVQLGCLGALHATVVVHGRAAHSARPWHGENALTKAGSWLAELHGRAPVDVDVDGLVYREVMTATQAHTTNARNVVPEELAINLNYRFAPDKDLAAAEAVLAGVVGDVGDHEVIDRAPAAPPFRDVRPVADFIAAADTTVAPKQAWTDVARLAEAGVPGLNYGPGLTAQAHQAGERVPLDNLVVARAALARFLASGPADSVG